MLNNKIKKKIKKEQKKTTRVNLSNPKLGSWNWDNPTESK
jgi:hypothetical protein